MNGDRPTESVNRRRFIKTAAAAVATGVGITAASTSAAADGSESDENPGKGKSGSEESNTEPCFPSKLEIEVKPGNGDQADPINPRSGGVIPVAVLQTDSFDPTERTVDYRFDAADEVGCDSAEPVHGGHVEDVDGDGDEDLVLHFDASETNFEHGDQKAELLWVESKGNDQKPAKKCSCSGLAGTDSVRIVGKK